MKYEKFKELSQGKFANFHSVEEAKLSGLLPRHLHKFVGNKCQCGSDRIISENLVSLRCCNPYCYIKQGYYLEKFLKNYGCEDIGAKTCISIMKEAIEMYGDNFLYLDLLRLEVSELPESLLSTKGTKFLLTKQSMLSVEIPFSKFITNLGIPTIEEGSSKIFSKYSNIEEVFEDLKKFKTVENLFYVKGVYDRSKIFNFFCYFSGILSVYVHMRDNITKAPLQAVNVVLTGSLSLHNRRITKQDYINHLNSLSKGINGEQIFFFKDTKARETSPYIVSDSFDYSESYRIGLRREEAGEVGVLQTSDSLEKILIAEVDKYNEQVRRWTEQQ